ncbi:unnamed protein product [Parajaminaea phylloscopi]
MLVYVFRPLLIHKHLSPVSSPVSRAAFRFGIQHMAARVQAEHVQYNDAEAYDSDSSRGSASSFASSDAPPLLDESFLPRILSLFFAYFHPIEGPKVVYQVPEGSVTAEEVGDTTAKGQRCNAPHTPASQHPPKNSFLEQEQLFDFDNLSEYLIPKAALCGKLITCTTKGISPVSTSRERLSGGGRSRSRLRSYSKGPSAPQARYYKVVSHPVLISDPNRYERNTFIFNLAFVFDGKADVKSYEPVVRKCARFLRDLEISQSFLSSPQMQPRMYSVVEQLFQDLNTYCESFIDLPEAYHTKYTSPHKGKDRDTLQASSASFRGNPAFVSFSSSLGRSNSTRKEREVTRRLSAVTDGVFSQDSTSRRSSGISDTRKPGSVSSASKYPDLTSTDATAAADTTSSLLMMSPIREASGLGNEGTQARSPISPKTLHTEAPAIASTIAASSRRSSDGSAIEMRRPSISRGKSISTAAVSEARASATSSSAVPSLLPATMQRALSSSSTGSSSSGTPAGTGHRPMLALSGHGKGEETEVIQDRHASVEAVAADLSSSLLSLRHGSRTETGEDAGVPVPTRPLPQTPGQREPPHGLGRTVREAINLRLFPTYANPPPVKDWDVPVSLLNLNQNGKGTDSGGRSSNWDLTMAAVFPYINGINHVKRISQLADADLELTRQCMEHLLYYGCILMVDIFQFFNIYALKPAIARIADDPGIQAECGAYVTRPGYTIPAWPVLLSLYTALRPGVVIDQWIEDRNVDSLGIDARRFITFGVIKGFIRRIHRYPVLLGGPEMLLDLLQDEAEDHHGRQDVYPSTERGSQSAQERDDSPAATVTSTAEAGNPSQGEVNLTRPARSHRQSSDVGSIRTIRPSSRNGSSKGESASVASPRKPLAGENSVAAKTNWSTRRPAARSGRYTTATVTDAANLAFETADVRAQERMMRAHATDIGGRQRLAPVHVPFSGHASAGSGAAGGSSSITLRQRSLGGLAPTPSLEISSTTGQRTRQAPNESSVTKDGKGGVASSALAVPPELLSMLDGMHCEDDICVHLGISWPQLRKLLVQLGSLASIAQAKRREDELGKPSTEPRDADEWLAERPAFGNVSGFAGQSSFFGPGAGLPSSSMQPSNPALSVPKTGDRSFPSRQGGQTSSSVGFGRSDLADPSRSGADLRDAQSTGVGSASLSGFFATQSFPHSLDALDFDEDEERLEREADLNGIVILTI